MSSTRMTDEQLQSNRAAVEEEENLRKAEARGLLEEKYRPLNDLLSSAEFQRVDSRVREIAPNYMMEVQLAPHLMALPQIFDAMRRVGDSAKPAPPANAPPAEPEA